MGDGGISAGSISSLGSGEGSVSGTLPNSPVQTSSSFTDLFNLPIVVKNPKKKKDNLLKTIHIGSPIRLRKSNRRKKKTESITKFEEYSIDLIKRKVSGIIKRTSDERRKRVTPSNGSIVADFDTNDGTAYFLIQPTYSDKVPSVNPKNGDFVKDSKGKVIANDNSYVVELQFVNWRDYIDDWSKINTVKFKDITTYADVKFSCTCPHWWWGGLAYWWTELDVSRYPSTIIPQRWDKLHKPVPTVCKHIKEILDNINTKSNSIVSQIRRKVRITKNK
jgi:hypothetical protein